MATSLNRTSSMTELRAKKVAVLALVISTQGGPVPPGGPKYVPVFVSSDALNQLNEKDGQNGNQASEAGHENTSQGPNSDYDIKNEIQHIFNGPPAPVYEHQPDHPPQHYQSQNTYQNNPQPGQLQYQNNQQPPQIQQVYQANPQPLQIPSYQVSQQPGQQYQISQPAQPQQLYQINQQPAMQPIVIPQQGTQPMFGNQKLLPNEQLNNQQPMLLNQQQLVAQPIQTYQQPNQLLISTPGNQQTVLTQPSQPILINQQPPLPNQQTLLLPQQPIQNGATLITSNINPIGVGQPNNQVNPGYLQNQNQNVYAMVPVNGQNVAPSQNVGTNTYLVPVQQMPNQVYAVNSG